MEVGKFRKLVLVGVFAALNATRAAAFSCNNVVYEAYGDWKCPPGSRLVTVAEAQTCHSQMCNMMSAWDIADLADGKMDGIGYGCKITPENVTHDRGGIQHRPHDFCYDGPEDSGPEDSGCLPPSSLLPGGYHCTHSCINGNTGIGDLQSAWEQCGIVEGCTRIMRYNNGLYYLRKADDTFDSNTSLSHVNYDCSDQCFVTVYRDCPNKTACGSKNGKSCAYLPGGLADNSQCGWNPCDPIVCNGQWQNICGGIDALEISGSCIAQLAKGQNGSQPYNIIYQPGFTGVWMTYENGVHIGDNAYSVRCGDNNVVDQNCEVSQWETWDSCSKECGGGVQNRSRSVTQAKQGNGSDCPALSDSQSCNTQTCDCQVGPWGAFNNCSKTCGTGTQTRTRSIVKARQGNGQACPSLSYTQNCNSHACPTAFSCNNVVYEAYGDWKCAPGSRLVTVAEAQTCRNQMCNMMSSWDIADLADGKMDGSGYGCKVTPENVTHDRGGIQHRPHDFCYDGTAAPGNCSGKSDYAGYSSYCHGWAHTYNYCTYMYQTFMQAYCTLTCCQKALG